MSTPAPIAPDPFKVITTKCVLSYPHLFKPRAVKPGDEPKYSATLIFDLKDSRPCLEQLRAAAFAAGRDRWKDFDAMVQRGAVRLPWRKGEDKGDAKGYGPGKIYINVNSNQAPGVVDRNVRPILNPSEIYPGVVVEASIRAFAYDMRGNKGVSFGLNHVRKVADGEPIGGRSRPEDDFQPLGDDPMFGQGGSTDDMFK
jgi:hypothetical protein